MSCRRGNFKNIKCKYSATNFSCPVAKTGTKEMLGTMDRKN